VKTALKQGISLKIDSRARKMVLVIVPLCILISGCATTRYTTVYCLTRAQFEQLKKSQPGKVKDRLTGKADIDVGILAGSAIRLRAHDDGLLEVLGGCVDPNKL
jgi:ABC-type uncharacterized transport system auxiliary subunit